ncbi:Hypothetical predicted protein [Mytilus galloprovincialis]|uniref:Uncharacterized protein n=1 Tax=Mytilus galloprovincialis TaxID=29158 RepID=A0A8B6BW27_MYTGA|nr:Hypothetical predicted protein [Mytilus galloprovincialis]
MEKGFKEAEIQDESGTTNLLGFWWTVCIIIHTPDFMTLQRLCFLLYLMEAKDYMNRFLMSCVFWQHMTPTPAVFYNIWVNCILIYIVRQYIQEFQRFCLFATHKDKVRKDDRSSTRETLTLFLKESSNVRIKTLSHASLIYMEDNLQQVAKS